MGALRNFLLWIGNGNRSCLARRRSINKKKCLLSPTTRRRRRQRPLADRPRRRNSRRMPARPPPARRRSSRPSVPLIRKRRLVDGKWICVTTLEPLCCHDPKGYLFKKNLIWNDTLFDAFTCDE